MHAQHASKMKAASAGFSMTLDAFDAQVFVLQALAAPFFAIFQSVEI
ncbi:hypothetical protein [Comamonas jiangduensis]|nr:hypothetical protein [Comamonas jiangduensis]